MPAPWHAPHHVFDGRYDADSVTVTLALGLALYNFIELFLLVSTTFKRWKGLYFWSMCVSTCGVMLYALGLMIDYFQLTVLMLGKIMDTIGWTMMITGQSLVLYSRLGLILQSHSILKAVKWMIICNACIWHPTSAVVDFGTTYTNNIAFAKTFFYIEHVQMTLFTLQEFIISGLYLWKTLAFLKTSLKGGVRRTIRQLFIINIIIVTMDIVLLCLQYKHLKLFQQSVKVFVYSVKLKLEFNILSKLVDLVHTSPEMTGDLDFRSPSSDAGIRPSVAECTKSPSVQSITVYDKQNICHVEHCEAIEPQGPVSVNGATNACGTEIRPPSMGVTRRS